MIRVLVAEDSAATRTYLVHLLDGHPALEVVGEAADGAEAVEQAGALLPDVIVMDVEMPRLDGYEATRRIMERFPTPIVMVSAHSRELENKGFEALRAGALVLLNKPPGPDGSAAAAAAAELRDTVRLMAEVKVVRRWTDRRAAASPPPAPAGRPVRLIAIGASAGGPPAVADIIAGLPGDLPCPVLLTQHIAPGFADGLAEWLGRAGPLSVKLAEANEVVRPATVYVAPDGLHLGIGERGRIRLADDPAIDGFRPSVSYMLSSVARTYGASAAGVVLTGMGRDGADGLLELRRRGGTTIVQDRASSVVFGMPMQAVRLGAAQHVLPPKRIAEALSALVDGRPLADNEAE